MERIQKSYLVTAGLKMVGMALMIGIVTVLVGFFASRVGAGIGRTLREKVFKQVVEFSNAEMDKFSTASLITRSTNDIQQIQMVSVMLLRMVAYAPILGVGGVLKVMQTEPEWVDHCPCNPCDPWLCDGIDGSHYAKVPVNAEVSG